MQTSDRGIRSIVVLAALITVVLSLVMLARAAYPAEPPGGDQDGRVSPELALVFSVLLVVLGAYLVRSTQIGPGRYNNLRWMVRAYVKAGGWILLVTGVLAAIHVLAILLGW